MAATSEDPAAVAAAPAPDARPRPGRPPLSDRDRG